MAKTIVHVNQHRIRHNAAAGSRDPVLTVKSRGRNRYGHEAVILDQNGREVARFVYRPDRPLKCGARVWCTVSPPYTVKPVLRDAAAATPAGDGPCPPRPAFASPATT